MQRCLLEERLFFYKYNSRSTIGFVTLAADEKQETGTRASTNNNGELCNTAVRRSHEKKKLSTKPVVFRSIRRCRFSGFVHCHIRTQR